MLSGNPFQSGPLPANLTGEAPGLMALQLQGAGGMLGAIPPDLGQLPLLRTLKLSNASLTGGRHATG